MGENEKQLKEFNEYFSKHYEEYIKKLKQWCFLNHLTYIDDEINDTYLKICEKILKNGIKAQTEQEYLNYFFQSYKFNTYQTHLQEQKRLIDDNVVFSELNLIDEEYSEDRLQFADAAKAYLDKKVKENFELLTYSIWRLRYIVEINGKTLNYKQIKELTGIDDTRRRIVEVNKWIRENISLDIVKKAIENNEIWN